MGLRGVAELLADDVDVLTATEEDASGEDVWLVNEDAPDDGV